MTDLSYLQDPEWLKQREIKWEAYSATWLFDVLDTSPELIRKKDYFFTGNISNLLTDEFETTLYDVISNTPFRNTKQVIDAITEYWFWVLEAPDSRDRFEELSDLNERFLSNLHAIFSWKDDNLDPAVCIGLFTYIYGESYNKNKTITLNHNDSSVTINVNINVDELCQTLISGIIKYLWRKDISENICIFKSLIPYFLSIYPQMSALYFDTKLPKKRNFIGDDGKKYFRKNWIWNRWLLTTLNGYITEYEEDEGIKTLECNDTKALAMLKDGLNTLNMPDEFYQLQKFVLEHKGDSLSLSG